MSEENKAYIRPKFEKENKGQDTEKKAKQVKINPEAGSKALKRIAIFHVNGNGDPDETQRASPQVQAYLKAFEQMKNVIVDIYPDNEAKFGLPFQYIAPFPVEVTDHLYWSEATLESYADDIWNHWKTNPHLIPSLIITIGPGAVYVCNTLFERYFWKIPWIYHGHWNVSEVDRRVNPDYFRVEDYAFTSADAIVYNSINERRDALILREQSIDERHIVIEDLQLFLYSLQMESEEKYNEEEKNNSININNYYGVFTSSNANPSIKQKKDILDEGDLEKHLKESDKKALENNNSDNNVEQEQDSQEYTPSTKLKSKALQSGEEEEDVVDQDYKKLTPKQRDEWNKKYGISEEELIGKNRDAYDAFIDKYTNLVNKCNQYQDKVYTKKQSCPYYVYRSLSSFVKYQERKKIFGYIKFILCLALFYALVQNITKNYDMAVQPFTILYSIYLAYLLIERIFVKRYVCGMYENFKFLGKIVFIGIALYYRHNRDIRCIGTATLSLLVDGFWNALKESTVYEFNLKVTIVKLLHVMFIRLILFPIWFFVGLMSRYKFPYFVFFGIMYLFNWNISYKVLEEYLFLLE